MEFRLSENLQKQLIAYDPQLRKLTKATQTQVTGQKKPSNRLGYPTDIIPPHIVDPAELLTVLKSINEADVQDRHHCFYRFQEVKGVTCRVAYAIIYHYESFWYASWLPNEDESDQYFYGLSFAFRNTAKVTQRLYHFSCFVRDHINETNYINYGRYEFGIFTKVITKEDIISTDGIYDKRHWVQIERKRKSISIFNSINSFTESLTKTLPTWKDSNNIFERIKCNNYLALLSSCYGRSEIKRTYVQSVEDKDGWDLSVNNFFNLIEFHYNHNHKEYIGRAFKPCYRIKHILNTPYFRKYIQFNLDEIKRKFNDPATESKKEIIDLWESLIETFCNIHHVYSVWPDAPIDYYQQHINLLEKVHFSRDIDMSIIFSDNTGNSREEAIKAAMEWIQRYVKPATFFNFLNKRHEEVKSNSSERRYYSYNGRFPFNDWEDTVLMLADVLRNNIDIKPPKRWRLDEFHDHVQAEAWKITNENFKLPQDLFPNPVKVQTSGKNLTFIQPIDTHQLAAWGRSVRNCVGNASSYANGVKNKKHFIILCLVDSDPAFTVQLSLKMGVLAIEQIKSVCNRNLTDVETELYSSAFSTALKIRDEELRSTVAV